MAGMKPIFEQGILGAGRRPFERASDLREVHAVDAAPRRGAAAVACRVRAFRAPAGARGVSRFAPCSSAATPSRVPAHIERSSTCQFLDEVSYARGGVHAIVEAMAQGLDVRCSARVERIEHARGPRDGVRLEGGESDRGRHHRLERRSILRRARLVGRRAPLRQLTPTMSCFLLYLGTDRTFDSLRHHTLLVGGGYQRLVRRDPARQDRVDVLDVRARAGALRAGHGTGGRRLALRAAAVPDQRHQRIDWDVESDRLRDALVEDLEETFGLRRARRVDRRRASDDASTSSATWAQRAGRRVRGSSRRYQQVAWLRPPNRDSGSPGCTSSSMGAARPRAPASRACCSAPRSQQASSPRTTASGRVLHRADAEGLAEARTTTKRVARHSRWRAGCCRASCATTCTSCTSPSARSTTSSTPATRTRRRGSRRSAWYAARQHTRPRPGCSPTSRSVTRCRGPR